MQFPKLTPLQSRFAASLLASVLLLVLYLTLTKPQFAYAAELDSRIPPDHNHPIIFDEDDEFGPLEFDDAHDNGLFPRAADGSSALSNNEFQNMNIDIGETQYWVFPAEAINGPRGVIGPGLPTEVEKSQKLADAALELRKRQSPKQVYISLNTCIQPTSNISNITSDAAIPPQLRLFYTQSQSNQQPGPSTTGDSGQTETPVDGGYALITLDTNDDVFIGVSAPNATGFGGIWNYDIAASIDGPFHSADVSGPNLHFVDGDSHAALLITNDTTQANSTSAVFQEWMKLRPPFGVFAQNQEDHTVLGMKNSFCGLQHQAQIQANIPGVDNQNVAGMTSRGLGGRPKEQFYITDLNATSKYWGWLAMPGNSTAQGNGVVGGGGKVWAAMQFNTKTEDNCALMYNLSFCSEVAYAVPTNPDKYSPITGLPDLAALYDSHAAQMYQYFNYSLQQIPCNTTSSAQYSLARNCDDCAQAYKQWLCAVTIPRCQDFSSTEPYLKIRNLGQPFVNGTSIASDQLGGDEQALLNSVATNSSRNPIIDDNIRPGPYKEVLPCQDLCWDLVQSCPVALGFGCPFPGRGLEDSYGKRSNNSGVISCSYLGAAYYLSPAVRGITTVAQTVIIGVAFVLSAWFVL